jgi:hypothetical protein
MTPAMTWPLAPLGLSIGRSNSSIAQPRANTIV